MIIATDDIRDLCQLDDCQPQEHRMVSTWMTGVITQLKREMWEQALAHHADHQFRDYI